MASVVIPLSAVTTSQISAGTAEGTAGTEVIIPIKIDSNPGIVSLSLDVVYDTDVLTLKSIDDKGLLKGSFHSAQLNSPYSLNWINDLSTVNSTVTGTLAELHFQIKDNASVGSYEVGIRMNKDYALNAGGNEVEFSLVDGTVKVIEAEHICSFGAWKKYSSTKHIRYCSYCPESQTAKHNWDDGEIIIQPTQTEDGKISYTCIDCNAKKTVSIPHPSPDDDVIHVQSISLDKNAISLMAGQSECLTATIKPSNATNQQITWVSSNTSVAKIVVQNSGNSVDVIAESNGTATISASAENGALVGTCTVTVTDKPDIIPVTGISLNYTSFNLTVGKSQTINATIVPDNATNQNIKWSSSNSSIASVVNGVVTANTAGTATITASTEDGGFMAQCKVTVVKDIKPEATIVIDSCEVMAGDTVQININLDNNPGLASLVLNVSYDESLLTLTKVEYNTQMSGQTVQPQSLKSPVILYWVNGFANYNGDGVFATLTFTVSESAQDGDKAGISITYNPDDVYNIDEENVCLNTIEGTVTVFDFVPGDINGDRVLNNKDVTRFMQYIAGWDVEVNEKALDVNGDGTVNNKDVTRLMQYNAGWSVQIFPIRNGTSEHKTTFLPAVSATCTQNGFTERWYCSHCDKYFSDEKATNEISFADTIVNATGHFVSSFEIVNANYHNIICSRCNQTIRCKHIDSHTCECGYEKEVCWVSLDEVDYWIDDQFGEAAFVPGKSEYWDNISYVASNVDSLRVWGWVSFFEETPGIYGYSIDGENIIYSEDFTYEAEEAVIKESNRLGGTSVTRMNIRIPVETMSGNHKISVYAKNSSEKDIFLFAIDFIRTDEILEPAPDTPETDTHTTSKIPATSATCTESGNIECWYCSHCDKYFTDEEATTEIAPENTVIPSFGHNISSWEALDAQYHCGTCNRCNETVWRTHYLSSYVCDACGYEKDVCWVSLDEVDYWVDGLYGDCAFVPGEGLSWNRVAYVASNVDTIRVWGWVSFFDETPGIYGYSINGKDIIYSEDFTYKTEQAVVDMAWITGSSSVTRMKIWIPVDTLSDNQKIYVYAKDSSGKDILLFSFDFIRIDEILEPTIPEEEPDKYTVDFNLPENEKVYMKEFGLAGIYSPVCLLGYSDTVYLGELDLSIFSSAIISYSCDGSPSTEEAFASSSSLDIGLKSENSSFGQETETNYDGAIAYTDMVFSEDAWSGAGVRKAVVDLSEISYNGDVWVAVHNPQGTQICIHSVQLVYN